MAKSRAQRKSKTTVFNLRLRTDLLAALRLKAQRERRTMSNLAQLIIEDALHSAGGK